MAGETTPYGKVDPYVHGYVHRVLPLVYDDALSHIETLARFTAKLNEVIEMCNTMSDSIIAEVNAYTDKKVAETFAKIDSAVEEIYVLKSELDKSYLAFTKATNAQLLLFNDRLHDLNIRIDETIVGINERTDKAIEQNNVLILNEMSKSLSKLRVVNFFTGTSSTVQEMFDYLAMMHTDNSMVYSDFMNMLINYNYLANKKITFTDLVLKGDNAIMN